MSSGPYRTSAPKTETVLVERRALNLPLGTPVSCSIRAHGYEKLPDHLNAGDMIEFNLEDYLFEWTSPGPYGGAGGGGSLLFERLFLHPLYALDLHVEVLRDHRFLMVDDPGWRYLPFTVGDNYHLRRWAKRVGETLYQKEREQLANFLKGVTSTTEGDLPKPFLLIPGSRVQLRLKAVRDIELSDPTLGVFLGRQFYPAHVLAWLNQHPSEVAGLQDVESLRQWMSVPPPPANPAKGSG